jgi:3-oxoacyl-[acyl-carrier protein] reductase
VSGRLEGRIAAVSGSSRGIGLAVARAFIAEGAKVAVNSRDAAVADRVAEDLGKGAVGIGADVSTEAGAKALVGGTIEAFGRIDVLINNAGMSAAAKTLDLELGFWQKVVDLNMTSVFLCSREAARHMLERGSGSIINTASIISFASFPRRLAYGATKAAVVMMTRMMAAEWAPAIRVNAVAPGYVRTEMTERLRRRAGSTSRPSSGARRCGAWRVRTSSRVRTRSWPATRRRSSRARRSWSTAAGCPSARSRESRARPNRAFVYKRVCQRRNLPRLYTNAVRGAR